HRHRQRLFPFHRRPARVQDNKGESMRYVVILLLGILLGGGAAIFFLGAPPAKAVPGQAVQPPDKNGNPPGTVTIGLEQSFVDAVLATTSRHWERRRFTWARITTARSALNRH